MFLFEGQHGNVLYTGDFRLAKGDAKRIPFFHVNGRIKDMKSIYIDTTFCLPKMKSLPSREQSRDTIFELITRWFSRGPEHVVSLLCKGMYGYEYLLKEVAMKYKTKIHVSAERLAMYRYLPDMTPYFTTDGRSTRIHSCNWESRRHCESDLPCGLSTQPSFKMKVLRIKPTTMWVARERGPMPADFKRYDKGTRLWRVVHSMHASMEEIQDLVSYLRPYHVYPNVPPAGLDSLEEAFERLRGLTRLQECDSCNQDESGEERFKEQAAIHYAEEKKQTDKADVSTKLLQVTKPSPDKRVLAQYKELGIDEEESVAPVPKRRKAKVTNVELEEKASTIATRQTAESVSSKDRTELKNVCSSLSVRSGNVIPVMDDRTTSKRLNDTTDKTDTTSGYLESRNTCGLQENRVVPLLVLRDKSKARRENDAGGREKRTQSDEVASNLPRTVGKVGDSNKITQDITIEEWISTAQSKSKGRDVECARNEVESAVERETGGFSEKNSDNSIDLNVTQAKPELCRNSCRDSVDEKSKQEASIVQESFIVDKNATAKECISSSAVKSHARKYGGVDGECTGNKIDFDIPPSPGNVVPRPDRLFSIQQSIHSGDTHFTTKSLKF